jgi:hypothetical protein
MIKSFSRLGLPSALIAALTTGATLAFSAGALAVSGTPINAGSPIESLSPAPSVAIDATGTAYIAWTDQQDTAGTGDTILYCVLPLDAVGCSHSNTLKPSGGSDPQIDNVQVLLVGSTVVLLADVFGVKEENTPEQEWTSTDGGATFTLANGGKSVADGIISADTEPLDAIVVPGTDALGYGWDSAAGGEAPFESAVPTFDEFPLSSPPTCSVSTKLKQFPPNCPKEEDFAALEPASNPDPIGNAGGQFASQLGTNPGVLAIFNTDTETGPLGCSGSFGTAFAYGSGEQSVENSYDISPGKEHSAWKVPVAQADCNVSNPAVGAGPSGFGVVEDNETTKTTVYHRFDQTTNAFDTPQTTISGQFEESPSVSQDGAGNVYVTYLDGFRGAIRLAYSTNGGTSWTGPATLNPDADAGASSLTGSVNAAG